MYGIINFYERKSDLDLFKSARRFMDSQEPDSERFWQWELFNRDVVYRIMNEHLRSKANYQVQSWALITFQHWYMKYGSKQ